MSPLSPPPPPPPVVVLRERRQRQPHWVAACPKDSLNYEYKRIGKKQRVYKSLTSQEDIQRNVAAVVVVEPRMTKEQFQEAYARDHDAMQFAPTYSDVKKMVRCDANFMAYKRIFTKGSKNTVSAAKPSPKPQVPANKIDVFQSSDEEVEDGNTQYSLRSDAVFYDETYYATN